MYHLQALEPVPRRLYRSVQHSFAASSADVGARPTSSSYFYKLLSGNYDEDVGEEEVEKVVVEVAEEADVVVEKKMVGVVDVEAEIGPPIIGIIFTSQSHLILLKRG